MQQTELWCLGHITTYLHLLPGIWPKCIKKLVWRLEQGGLVYYYWQGPPLKEWLWSRNFQYALFLLVLCDSTALYTYSHNHNPKLSTQIRGLKSSCGLRGFWPKCTYLPWKKERNYMFAVRPDQFYLWNTSRFVSSSLVLPSGCACIFFRFSTVLIIFYPPLLVYFLGE